MSHNDIENLIQSNILPSTSLRDIEIILNNGRNAGTADFWINYNLPFLEAAFQRGDNIRLVSDPSPSSGTRTGSYANELDEIDNILLQQFGYTYNQQNKTYEKL